MIRWRHPESRRGKSDAKTRAHSQSRAVAGRKRTSVSDGISHAVLWSAMSPASLLFSHSRKSEIVGHVESISLEGINRFHKSGPRIAFKQRSRTPRILARHRHDRVFHRILMYMIQPRQPRFLERHARVTEFVHHSSPQNSIA